MRKRSKSSGEASVNDVNTDEVNTSVAETSDNSGKAKRSTYVILALFVLIIQGSWAVHHYQFEILPQSLTAEQAGKRGFSEEEALKHVKALTEFGPHPVGSDALDHALQVFIFNESPRFGGILLVFQLVSI